MSNNPETEKNKEVNKSASSAKNEVPRFYSRSDEEFSAEVADVSTTRSLDQRGGQIYAPNNEVEKGRGWGLTALILSIAAWFIWPSLLAPAAVIAGLVAFLQGRRGLGSVAIVIGLIAFFFNMGTAIL